VHQWLLEKDESSVYQAWVHDAYKLPEHLDAKGEDLLELIVFQSCDIEKLTPERLAQLNEDREAISALRGALNDIAASIPQMRNRTKLKERLQAATNDALNRWRNDQVNMSQFSRELFSVEGLKPTADFMKKVSERMLESTSTPISGAIVGGLTTGTLLGAAAGLAIGVIISHGLSSLQRVRERAKNSPFRYLTQIEKSGVVFAVGSGATP
jgi:hypothetical protein